MPSWIRLIALFASLFTSALVLAESSQLIDNPSFTLGSIEPWYRWQSTEETAYLEEGALVVETDSYWQVVQQDFSYEPGEEYRLSFQAKTNQETRLSVLIYDWTASRVLGRSLVAKNKPWNRYFIYFKAPLEAGHRLSIRLYPQDYAALEGRVWVDQVFITPRSLISLPSNLVFNGSFDNSESLAPWYRWQSTEQTAYLEDGALAIETDGSWQVVEQALAYEPGANYSVLFEAKTNLRTRLSVLVYDRSSRSVLGRTLLSSGLDWGLQRFQFTAPEEAGHLLTIRFYPQDRLVGNGKVWIDDVQVFVEDFPPFVDPVYQSVSDGEGNQLSVKVGDFDEPELWSGNTRLTNDEFIQFDPALSSSGRFAYSQTNFSNTQTKIFLDTELIEDDLMFNSQAQFLGESLVWLKTQYYNNIHKICRYWPRDSSKQCTSLEFIPDRLLISDTYAVVSGFDPNLDVFRLAFFDDELDLVFSESFVDSIFLSEVSGQARLTKISGDAQLKRLFFAYRLLSGKQRGQAFSFGNDYLGRLGNNVAIRLLGMLELFQKTKDLALLSVVRGTVGNLIRNAAEDGRFYSKKYSLNQQSEIAFAVDNALIYYAALKSAPLLFERTRKRLIVLAESMFQSFESDWLSYYRFTPCLNSAWDGAVMPFNQQNVLGLVALELHRHTSDNQYLVRLAELFENMRAELEVVQGTSIWHYWPRIYYDGWELGEIVSCNATQKLASQDSLYEDMLHAQLNADFLIRAADYLGEPRPIDLVAIADNLLVAPNQFARFISGDVEYSPPLYRYLPRGVFAEAESIASYFDRHIVLPYPDFDNQELLLSYARAFSQPKLGDRLEIYEYQFEDLSYQLFVTDSFEVSQGGCLLDGVFSQQTCVEALSAFFLVPSGF